MPRFLALLLWSTVFCAVLLLIDQFFVRIPQRQPALVATRQFYVDFRQRLFALGQQTAASKPTIESLIEREQQPSRSDGTPPTSAAEVPPPRTTQPAAPPQPAAPTAKSPSPAVATAVSPPKASGYVYADAAGTLQMVERLDQVPTRFRASAQPLTR